MNANWSGLFRGRELVERALERITTGLGTSKDEKPPRSGTRSSRPARNLRPGQYSNVRRAPWSLANPEHVTVGSIISARRSTSRRSSSRCTASTPMLPISLSIPALDPQSQPGAGKVPVVETFRGRATQAMRGGGLANWALSMGRQRLGALTLKNHPQFLQNLELAAASERDRQDLCRRPRSHQGPRARVPRFNEFRRQNWLRQLTRFDDFVDARLENGSPERAEQGAPGGPPAPNSRTGSTGATRPRSSPTPR